jgi:hypothetical protein
VVGGEERNVRRHLNLEEKMTIPTTTAVETAKDAGISPKKFRRVLRNANLIWHGTGERWTAEVDSKEHEEMKRGGARPALIG